MAEYPTIEQLRFLILAAQREGNRLLAGALRELGLTPAQAEVLRLLDDHGPLSLSGLGALLICESGTNPSRLVERLVAAGLVERESDAGDARKLRLVLTARGRSVAGHVSDVEHRFHEELHRRLGATDVKAACTLLEALVIDTPAGEALALRAALTEQEPTR